MTVSAFSWSSSNPSKELSFVTAWNEASLDKSLPKLCMLLANHVLPRFVCSCGSCVFCMSRNVRFTEMKGRRIRLYWKYFYLNDLTSFYFFSCMNWFCFVFSTALYTHIWSITLFKLRLYRKSQYFTSSPTVSCRPHVLLSVHSPSILLPTRPVPEVGLQRQIMLLHLFVHVVHSHRSVDAVFDRMIVAQMLT